MRNTFETKMTNQRHNRGLKCLTKETRGGSLAILIYSMTIMPKSHAFRNQNGHCCCCCLMLKEDLFIVSF